MRAVLIVSLLAGLGGCQSIRSGLGAYQKAADKGITVGGGAEPTSVGPVIIAGGRPDTSLAPPGSVTSDSAPPAPDQRPANAATKTALPGGLGGDKEHRAYSSDARKL